MTPEELAEIRHKNNGWAMAAVGLMFLGFISFLMIGLIFG